MTINLFFLFKNINELSTKIGYVFNFEKGPKFSVLSTDGKEVISGNYGIGFEDKSVTLQLTPDQRELSYGLSAIEGGYNRAITTRIRVSFHSD